MFRSIRSLRFNLSRLSSETMSNYIDRDGGGYGKSLINLNFDNQVLKNLPIDPIEDNSCRCVADACFSRVKPTPVLNPRLVCYSKSALALIDISHEAIDGNDFLIQCFSGNEILPGSETAAHCYCGHQFGIDSKHKSEITETIRIFTRGFRRTAW